MNYSFLPLRLKYLLLIFFTGFGLMVFPQKGNQPNIVFILADDLGWADLPCYGNTFNEAPNLDKLSQQGIRFTNAYAACPVCSPTRASIQSGQYPARVGIIDFISGHWRPYEEVTVPVNRYQYLPAEIITMAESLKKSGYKTAYFGKWHLGYDEEFLPSNQGYDKSHIYHGGGYYSPEFIPSVEPDRKGRLSEILTDFSVDFYPTLLEVAGAYKPEHQVLDGKSILPELLQDEFEPERSVFWHYPVYHHDVPASAIRKGDWKLIKNLVTGKSELYNLMTDIGETLDLSLLYPEKASELYKLLSDWQNDTGAEFPIENPDFDDKRRYSYPIRRF